MISKSAVSQRFTAISALAIILLAACGLGGCATTDEKSSNGAKAAFLGGGSMVSDEVAATSPAARIDVLMAMARSYDGHGETERSKQIYDEILKIDGRFVEAQHRLGLALCREGDLLRAEQLFRAALETGGESAVIYSDLGYNLYLQQRWPEAEECLRKSLHLAPHLQAAHNNLGMLLARTNRFDESLVEFARAGCKESEARNNLAFACTLQGRFDVAEHQYRLALQADHQMSKAQYALQTVHKLRNNGRMNSLSNSAELARGPSPGQIPPYGFGPNQFPATNFAAPPSGVVERPFAPSNIRPATFMAP